MCFSLINSFQGVDTQSLLTLSERKLEPTFDIILKPKMWHLRTHLTETMKILQVLESLCTKKQQRMLYCSDNYH